MHKIHTDFVIHAHDPSAMQFDQNSASKTPVGKITSTSAHRTSHCAGSVQLF